MSLDSALPLEGLLIPKPIQAHLSSLRQSNIVLWWREMPLQDRLVRPVLVAYLKLLKSSASCKATGTVNTSLQISTRTTAEAPKMSTRSWAPSTHLIHLQGVMTAPSSLVQSGLWLIIKSQRTPSGLSIPLILVLARALQLPLAGILRTSTKGVILGASLGAKIVCHLLSLT